MEFVDGETVEKLLRNSQRLDSEIALEIISQTAAGLTAIQKEHLVHRDIKPSNITVRLEAGKVEVVKVIDLGLAKQVEGMFALTESQLLELSPGRRHTPVPNNLVGCSGHSFRPVFLRNHPLGNRTRRRAF
jgi:serine/threonine protein kinase